MPRRVSAGEGWDPKCILPQAVRNLCPGRDQKVYPEAALIAVIDYTCAGNLIFGTGPPAPAVWLLAAGCALVMLLLEETRKWAARRVSRR